MVRHRSAVRAVPGGRLLQTCEAAQWEAQKAAAVHRRAFKPRRKQPQESPKEVAAAALERWSDSEEEEPEDCLERPCYGGTLARRAVFEAVLAEGQAGSTLPAEDQEPNSALLRFSRECRRKRLLPLASRVVAGAPGETALALARANHGSQLFGAYAEYLAGSPQSLTAVDVSDNSLDEQGCSKLLEALSSHSALSKLSLAGNSLGLKGAAALTRLLTCGLPLEELCLARVPLSTQCLEHLMPGVAGAAGLQSLDLSHAQIAIEGGQAVGSMIENNKGLTALDLSWNQLRLSGATAISKALRHNSSLTQLQLGWNGFGDAEMCDVAEHLGGRSYLRTLELQHNHLNERGVVLLLDAMAHNPECRLERLDLSGNVVGRAGVTALYLYRVSTRQPCHVVCSGINSSQADPSLFSGSEDPAGEYQFDLADQYEAAVCAQFARSMALDSTGGAGEPARAMLNGSALGDLNRLPSEGLVCLSYQRVRGPPTEAHGLTEEQFSAVLGLVVGPHHSVEDAKQLLQGIPSNLFLSSAQAERLYRSCNQVYPSTADCGAVALLAVFHSVLDPWVLEHTLQHSIPPHSVQELRRALGWTADFQWANPTGHYDILLNSAPQRAVLRRLCELSSWQRRTRLSCGSWSREQHEEAEGFRNLTLDGVPVAYHSGLRFPAAGHVMLDFVLDLPIQQLAPPLPFRAFQLGTLEEAAFQELKEALCTGGPRSPAVLHCLGRHSLTATQVARLVDTQHCEAAREELLVSTFSHTQDRLEFTRVVHMQSAGLRKALARRLGPLNLFNPLLLREQYVLNLSHRDCNLTAQLLLQLSQEGRASWPQISITEGDAPAKLLKEPPGEWLEGELPGAGELCVAHRPRETPEPEDQSEEAEQQRQEAEQQRATDRAFAIESTKSFLRELVPGSTKGLVFVASNLDFRKDGEVLNPEEGWDFMVEQPAVRQDTAPS